jgi:hypothetical protein
MVGSVRSLELKIKAWNDSLGTIVKKRCTILSDSVNKSGQLSNKPSSGQTTSWNGTLTRKVTAHVAYRPCPIPAMSNLQRQIRGFLDLLGFELNPAIIWEAVPFSFVVDWFINVGGYLNGFKFDTLELPIHLVDSYLQYNQSLLIDTFVTSLASSDFPKVVYPGAIRSETFFHRMPIFPHTEDLFALGWRLPTSKQFVLGLALGLSR